jgi:fused signal recognition particle receptor
VARGLLGVKTTPAYAQELKRPLSSVSSLAVRLSPDRKGRELLRKKRHPRVAIQLTLIATSGPRAGLAVTHTGTVTIGVGGSPRTEAKPAAQHRARAGTKAAREAAMKQAQAETAAKKKAEEEAAKKRAEVAADKAAAAKDEAEATADKATGADDEREALQLLGGARSLEREAVTDSERSGEAELDAGHSKKVAEEENNKAQANRQTAEGYTGTELFFREEAKKDRLDAANEERNAELAESKGNYVEAENDENRAQADYDAEYSAEPMANQESWAAKGYETEATHEEAKATLEELAESDLDAMAKAGREAAKNDEATASKDKTRSTAREHEAPASKQLAEQKENEAAAERHAAEVAEKA